MTPKHSIYAGRLSTTWWWAREHGAKKVTGYNTSTRGRWWCPGPNELLEEGVDLFHSEEEAAPMVAALQQSAAEEEKRRTEAMERARTESEFRQAAMDLQGVQNKIAEDRYFVPSTMKRVVCDTNLVPREQYCDWLLRGTWPSRFGRRKTQRNLTAWKQKGSQVKPPQTKKRDWSKVNWEQTTLAISKQLGEWPDKVSRARCKYAPETVKKYKANTLAMIERYKDVDWTKSDWVLAEELGKAADAVRQLRRKLGKAPGPACCPTCKRPLETPPEQP